MVCFCKDTASTLALTLPSLSIDLSASLNFSLTAAAQIGAMAKLLVSLGLPAAPWNPDPSWLQLQLPTISLSASAMATLTLFAQLKATLALLGLDVTTSLGVSAFAELSASIAARLSMLLSLGLSINAGPFAQMSAALQACAQITAALSLDLFAPINVNINMSLWADFILQLRLLLPVLSLVAQLNLDLTADISAQLSLALKLMLGIPMPQLPIVDLTLMASLTSTLSAIAQIKLSLGIDPLSISLPALKLMVEEKIQATIALVESVLGMSFSAALQLMASLQFCPTLLATPLNVRLAANLNFPPLNWNFPAIADLPVLSIGLPIAAFVAQLKAALNLNMALSPCMTGCDMAALGL